MKFGAVIDAWNVIDIEDAAIIVCMIQSKELVAYPVYAGGIAVEHLRIAEPCLYAVWPAAVVVCHQCFTRERIQLHSAIQVSSHKQVAVGSHAKHINAAACQGEKAETLVAGTEFPQSVLQCAHKNVASRCYGNSVGTWSHVRFVLSCRRRVIQTAIQHGHLIQLTARIASKVNPHNATHRCGPNSPLVA